MMHYKIIRENRPHLKNYGKYKAVAVHANTIGPKQIRQEIQANCSAKASDVILVLNELSTVVAHHLRQGDRVRIEGLGLAKLEIESDKVDTPSSFRPRSNIRGIRLHLLPESKDGKPILYQDIKFRQLTGDWK